MSFLRLHRPWREPPIVLQILVLLVGGLVIAQLVTLLLTLALPPAPPVQHSLSDIVAELRGQPSAARLARTVQKGPPDVSGPGWFTSDQSRRTLASLLGVREEDVRLSFYAPLPFAGVALPPPAMDSAMRPIAWHVSKEPLISLAARALPINMLLVADSGPPGGGMRGGFGGGAPGSFGGDAGGFAGGRGDGGNFGGGQFGGRGGSGQFGGRGMGGAGGRGMGGGDASRQDRGVGGHQPSPGDLDRQPFAPGAQDEGDRGGRGFGDDGGVRDGFGGRQIPTEGFDPNRFSTQPLAAPLTVSPVTTTAPPQPAPSPAPATAPAPRPSHVAETAPAPAPAAEPARTQAPAALAPEARRQIETARPVPIAPRTSALFGLAPAPFVEGDFVAAVRGPDGRWTVVQPAAEGFPNAWQRRVILWFLIAFALVAPIGLLYARHIVRPLARFTEAAEQLGRDPSAALVALEGPAEIGRAAHAFNVMQNRLRSFVDDRTAMVGAISHDLRTPLTRLRFRIEEVDDEGIREGMTGEVAEMEAMITSVLTFIRDASTPNVRERLDLGMLVEDVVQDAALVGGDVAIEATASAPVEVDVLGMRRLLANLVENAVKYGDRARIRLAVEEDAAVAEIRDDGPGVPVDELERAFEPFYRASNATSSGKEGTGLGLAVCRSIARAHGGDVRLVHSEQGFAAELRLPLAYDAGRIAA